MLSGFLFSRLRFEARFELCNWGKKCCGNDLEVFDKWWIMGEGEGNIRLVEKFFDHFSLVHRAWNNLKLWGETSSAKTGRIAYNWWLMWSGRGCQNAPYKIYKKRSFFIWYMSYIHIVTKEIKQKRKIDKQKNR